MGPIHSSVFLLPVSLQSCVEIAITYIGVHIVACLDSRCNPYDIFNLTIAEAIVARNPGGRVWSALNDIVALDARFGIQQLVLLQHTDCGTSHLTEELVHERIAEAAEPTTDKTLKVRDEVVRYTISHGEEGVREDMALLKASKFLRRDLVDRTVGFWMDTTTGLVKKVE
jgi:carbonic anhydrase